MSTTVELVRANERYARLRAAVEQLAGQFDAAAQTARRAAEGRSTAEWAQLHGTAWTNEDCAADLRALLAAVDS